MINKIFDLLIGQPLSNEEHASEKFNVPFGLAIMASDAISSVAYAAQEILWVLIPVVGLLSYIWLGWVSLMIIGLLLILTASYIQIIRAYPQGGGAYLVAKENIGIRPGLVAAAALLIDYILTVAVSASAGVAAIISAYPGLKNDKVALVVGLIIILTILNLRGLSESSKIFSIPTYLFIFSMIFMIIYGLIRYSIYGAPTPMVTEPLKSTGIISIYLILRAFSSGCSALTGLEAVSNSVPNFKEPGQKNARIVMMLLAGLILFIFGGTSVLARFYHSIPMDSPTVVAQIAYGVFGKTFMFYVIQVSTAVILLMACNTAFTGFPTLMSVIGRDGYVPRQFTLRGKRLSFSTGIVVLSLVASILVVIFHAETHLLIPLYSVGVFLSFTLAQVGMVIHWRKCKEKGWQNRAAINGFGAVITIITTVIIIYEKALGGAWIVLLLIPIFVVLMLSIKEHYNNVADSLRTTPEELKRVKLDKKYEHIAVVPIASLNKATLKALEFARGLTDDVIALNVSTDVEAMEKLEEKWKELNTDIHLVAKYSPFRAIISPLVQYITEIEKASDPNQKVTVILPEFITHEWWGQFLHNHTGLILRETLLRNSNITIATCPYHVEPADEDDENK